MGVFEGIWGGEVWGVWDWRVVWLGVSCEEWRCGGVFGVM